ncbi:MAG: hypothetical protein ABSG59_22935 [Verrucomicrobiota bacterium]
MHRILAAAGGDADAVARDGVHGVAGAVHPFGVVGELAVLRGVVGPFFGGALAAQDFSVAAFVVEVAHHCLQVVTVFHEVHEILARVGMAFLDGVKLLLQNFGPVYAFAAAAEAAAVVGGVLQGVKRGLDDLAAGCAGVDDFAAQCAQAAEAGLVVAEVAGDFFALPGAAFEDGDLEEAEVVEDVADEAPNVVVVVLAFGAHDGAEAEPAHAADVHGGEDLRAHDYEALIARPR